MRGCQWWWWLWPRALCSDPLYLSTTAAALPQGAPLVVAQAFHCPVPRNLLDGGLGHACLECRRCVRAAQRVVGANWDVSDLADVSCQGLDQVLPQRCIDKPAGSGVSRVAQGMDCRTAWTKARQQQGRPQGKSKAQAHAHGAQQPHEPLPMRGNPV
jgi:hypothetical protein